MESFTIRSEARSLANESIQVHANDASLNYETEDTTFLVLACAR